MIPVCVISYGAEIEDHSRGIDKFKNQFRRHRNGRECMMMLETDLRQKIPIDASCTIGEDGSYGETIRSVLSKKDFNVVFEQEFGKVMRAVHGAFLDGAPYRQVCLVWLIASHTGEHRADVMRRAVKELFNSMQTANGYRIFNCDSHSFVGTNRTDRDGIIKSAIEWLPDTQVFTPTTTQSNSWALPHIDRRIYGRGLESTFVGLWDIAETICEEWPDTLRDMFSHIPKREGGDVTDTEDEMPAEEGDAPPPSPASQRPSPSPAPPPFSLGGGTDSRHRSPSPPADHRSPQPHRRSPSGPPSTRLGQSAKYGGQSAGSADWPPSPMAGPAKARSDIVDDRSSPYNRTSNSRQSALHARPPPDSRPSYINPDRLLTNPEWRRFEWDAVEWGKVLSSLGVDENAQQQIFLLTQYCPPDGKAAANNIISKLLKKKSEAEFVRNWSALAHVSVQNARNGIDEQHGYGWVDTDRKGGKGGKVGNRGQGDKGDFGGKGGQNYNRTNWGDYGGKGDKGYHRGK